MIWRVVPVVLIAGGLLSACAAPPKPSAPIAGLQTVIVKPGFGTAPLYTSNLNNDVAANSRVFSTIYEVRKCQHTSDCSLGVVKPEISTKLIKQSSQGIEVELTVDYSVDAGQVLETPGTRTEIRLPPGVPVLKENKRIQHRASLHFGEARRIDLGHGDAVLFCARRVPKTGSPEIDNCPVDLAKLENMRLQEIPFL